MEEGKSQADTETNGSFQILPMDLWVKIARKANGTVLANLAATSSLFHNQIVDNIAWREAFFRDFVLVQQPIGEIKVTKPWRAIYGYAVDKTEAGINSIRVGAVMIESSSALLSFKLPIVPSPYVIQDVKNGIWIVDFILESVHDGGDKVFILEARHCEEARKQEGAMWANIGNFTVLAQQDKTHMSLSDALHIEEENRLVLLKEASWTRRLGLEGKVSFHGAQQTCSRPPPHRRSYILCQAVRSPLNAAVRIRFKQQFPSP